MRFARRRFGYYDLIDFVVVLLGYAVSSERTLEAFYERVHPFAAPFMAQIAARTPPSLIAQRSVAFAARAGPSASRGIAYCVSRRLSRPTAGEEGTNGMAVGSVRNTVARVRCVWHVAGGPSTGSAIYT